MNVLPHNAPRQQAHVHSVEDEGSTDTAEDERRHGDAAEDERLEIPTMLHEILSQMTATMIHMAPPQMNATTNAVMSTVPPISPPSPRKQLCTRSCSNKHTHPLSKASAPFGFDNAHIGPSLSHVSLYHTKLLSRTYLYDFVCDVIRFTHLVTSQCCLQVPGTKSGQNILQRQVRVVTAVAISLHSGIEFGWSRTGEGSSGGRKKGMV